MFWNDDDDETLSASHADYFTHADQGLTERREEKAREKGALLALRRDVLRSNIAGSDGKISVAAPDDAQSQVQETIDDSTENARPTPGGTKTQKQRERRHLQMATDTPDIDTLADAAQAYEKSKDDAPEEYQKDAG